MPDFYRRRIQLRFLFLSGRFNLDVALPRQRLGTVAYNSVGEKDCILHCGGPSEYTGMPSGVVLAVLTRYKWTDTGKRQNVEESETHKPDFSILSRMATGFLRRRVVCDTSESVPRLNITQSSTALPHKVTTQDTAHIVVTEQVPFAMIFLMI